MAVGAQAHLRQRRGGQQRLHQPQVRGRAVRPDKVVVPQIVKGRGHAARVQIVAVREQPQRNLADLARDQRIAGGFVGAHRHVRFLLGQVDGCVRKLEFDHKPGVSAAQPREHRRQHLDPHELGHRQPHDAGDVARPGRRRAPERVRGVAHRPRMFVQRMGLRGRQQPL